jgi:DnaD/phage-associated family protein
MKTLKVKNQFQANATFISNDFIDNYMARANGEFVKVYLFLLRHLSDPCAAFTVSSIADCLGNTENDVLRAFRYWEAEGLLNLERDEDGRITGLELVNVPALSGTSAEPAADMPAAFEPEPAPAPVSGSKAIPLSSLKAQKELKDLLFITEQYLGKTLSHTDVEAITYFYHDLKMSKDLIEYLVESCVENGHKSMRYMKKVALSWSDDGVTTVEQAKLRSSRYNQNCYTVLNAFGIKNRGPAESELAYINKWTQQMGFSLELVQEACRRTISATHQASFEYADSILERWHDNHVHHLGDISALDEAFHREKESRRSSTSRNRSAAKNMNNFERRTYDMDSLEEQLLKSN